MKKQLIVVGIIILLFTVGLCGCNEIGLTNIGDITANPNKFINKEVKVEGTCIDVGEYGYITDDNGHTIPFISQGDLIGRYRLIGIIMIDATYLSSNTNPYINVTKAEAI